MFTERRIVCAFVCWTVSLPITIPCKNKTMIDYIRGDIASLQPTKVVLESFGVGYSINISLPTYSVLNGKKDVKLFIYEAIREDAYVLYGFLTTADRELFLALLSVSGVGASTARIILSSLSAIELRDIIVNGDVATLKLVKGIGQRTAERIIVDLKDKMAKLDLGVAISSTTLDTSVKTEAIAALVMLGFAQAASQKAVDKVLKSSPDLSVEQLIKLALKAF